jgi:hypothetical protein
LQNDQFTDEDSLWMAGQVLTLADDQAAQIAQEAQDDAAAIRAAAEREAAAIREAAERETAEQRARLDSMLEELGRVVAAYGTKSLVAPAMPATAPAHLGELAVPNRAQPAPESPAGANPAGKTATLPAKPRTTPAGPRTVPKTEPAKPKGKPVSKQQTLGRQKRAMRIAKYGTTAAVIFALAAGAVEIGQHGYGFFVFRENGQGNTPSVQPGRAGDNRLDTDFLAAQAAAKAKAAHQAPKGKHHKPAHQTATSTKGG